MSSAISRRVSLVVCLVAVLTPESVSAATTPDGRELFIESCASCHASDGRGTDSGPSIVDAGAAAADFQLRTGRMPLADNGAQTTRKPPAFTSEEIEALTTFVASLGAGPDIPTVDLGDADLSNGQELFVANCAACHGATGNGGAVGAGALAPSLHVADPVEIAEAMLTGPGEMPVFAGIEGEDVSDIIAFVVHLREQRAFGGADIGGIGPVPEGFVGLGIGVACLVAISILLGSKRKRDET
jgi:ubiquinol-cytochrome c reductase cytochrome c subunit